jgi:fructose-bisphosphate aldolase class II
MLVHIKDIVSKAHRQGYAVGAFNTFNLEVTLGIAQAAVKTSSPVIIQVSEGSIKYAGLKPITHIVQTIAKNASGRVPVALHLDHGKDFLTICECINAGFSSVHIDASELPYDENVSLTKKVVAYAKKYGVWVQGELGVMLGKEGDAGVVLPDDPNEYLTNAVAASEYVSATKVNTLAVSVGTMHGIYKGKEYINQQRLRDIHRKTKLPLVLHGGSGIGAMPLRAAVKNGIRIVNIDTELRIAFTDTLRKTLRVKKTVYDPRKLLLPSITAVAEVVEEKMKILGCIKKAY